jgi:putative oxidoreductase
VHAALLILRIVVGLLFIGHGSQKLFGWFGGHGPEGTGQFLDSLGYRPGRGMAIAAGGAEFFGGLFLALGFLTPLASAMIIGVMLNAILSVHWSKGIWNSNGGLEFPLVMAAVAAAVSIAGPGRFSLDRALGIPVGRPVWQVGGILLGVVSGVGLYAWRMVTTPSATPAEEHHRDAA